MALVVFLIDFVTSSPRNTYKTNMINDKICKKSLDQPNILIANNKIDVAIMDTEPM